MLSTASQFTPRARSLQAQHGFSAKLVAVSSVAGIQRPQQTRGFRFGKWFSQLDDPEFQQEIRRRHRVLKHKYAEQVNRRLSWDQHPFAEDARHALRRMTKSYWISHDARPGGRYVNDVEPDKRQTPTGKDGVRPGRNIEDVERGAMDHLLYGKDEQQEVRNPSPRKRQRARSTRSVFDPRSFCDSIEQDDFVIDPITNRKVAKHPAPSTPKSGGSIPVKTFKNPDVDRHNSILDQKAVRFEDLKPPYEDLDKYRSVVVDDITARFLEDAGAPYSDLHKYNPVIDQVMSSRKETQPRYNDLDKYRPVIDEVKSSRDSEQPKYDDLDKYKPVIDEVASSKDETQPEYDDLNKYKRAEDGIVSSIDETQPKYLDLDKYEPIVDKIALQEEHTQPKYDDLDRYDAFEYHEPHDKSTGHQVEPVIATERPNQESSTEGVHPGDFPQSTLQKLRNKYNSAELNKYTAARHLELHGERAPTAEELSKIYDPQELAKYGPVRWNEPDGHPIPAADPRVAEGLTKDYDPEELAQYNKPVYWNEPDGQPLPSHDERVAEALTKNYADLEGYGRAYRWNEPDGKPMPFTDSRVAEELSEDYTDLDEYKHAYRWNEPDGKPTQTAGELTKDYTDLDEYSRAYTWNEPDGKPTPTAEALSKDYSDLEKYGPVKYQEPDGQPATKTDSVQQSLGKSDSYDYYESAEVSRKVGQGRVSNSDEKSNRLGTLDSLMERHQSASDAIDKEASLAVKSAKAKAEQRDTAKSTGPMMTGTYARDFPQEFSTFWVETISKAEAQPEITHVDGGLKGAFGQSSSRIQTALDRQPSKGAQPTGNTIEPSHTDLYSKKHEDMEAHENCAGEPAWSADGKQYGLSSSTGEDVHGAASRETSSKSDSTGEPTYYKILAYDPIMQDIEMAETSSYVPDTASALTPADALARLSNPARFFPHFASLEADGYEIVSGNGDVLVFRKVRPSTKQAGATAAVAKLASTVTESRAPEGPINPIDMTGRAKMSPASANFASPTGYVNYENLPGTEASNLPPPPRIKYNIDVQREEPVFSGPKVRSFDGRQKKKGLGKRLIVGGVWVASISYALGVVSEYFTTGGVDGLGPKGL